MRQEIFDTGLIFVILLHPFLLGVASFEHLKESS